MLAGVHRLRRTGDFTEAVKRGRRAGRQTLVVHVANARPGQAAAGPDCGSGRDDRIPVRVGFIVSKAVGPAVVRNRVKRRLRHLVAERLSDLPSGGLVVVRALPSAAASPTAVLRSDLDAALRRVATPGQPRRAGNRDPGGPR